MLGSLLGVPALTATATAQETTRVSVDSSGTEADGVSVEPALSSDGGSVAFLSVASNFIAGDNPWSWDVFVHDRASGQTECVSVDTGGAPGSGNCDFPSVSADGRWVAFFSDSSSVVAGDTNGVPDIFVRDRLTGTTERVSVDSNGAESNGWSITPTISPDGRFVVFDSVASNLVAGDTNLCYDAFIHDRSTGITERVSVDSTGAEGNGDSGFSGWLALSADGQIVAFDSSATNLVAGDTNLHLDVFVHDRGTGITERVSVRSTGKQANNASSSPSLSADGRLVEFQSQATNLVPLDTNGAGDVFVHDRSTGVTERVSVDSSGVEGNGDSLGASLSADGNSVVFASVASNLVAADTNAAADVFVHRRSTGVTERASIDSSGTPGNGDSSLYDRPAISADGRVVAFNSDATNLVAGDVNGLTDIFVDDSCSIAASWSNYGAGFPGSNGVPTFTSQQNPVFGASLTLDVSNSYGNPTAGLLFIGFARASVPSNWGGDLLVAPVISQFISFSFGGDSFVGTIPDDPTLCGFAIDLQVIEADPGAAKGVSFTPGLELTIGS